MGSDLKEGGRSGGDDKGDGLGHILREELTEFVGGMDVRNERERGVQDDSKSGA